MHHANLFTTESESKIDINTGEVWANSAAIYTKRNLLIQKKV